MDNHLFGSVTELQAAIERGDDPHAEVAAVLFGPGYTRAERTWAKYLNMVASLHLSAEAAIDLFQVPAEQVREMLGRYRRAVLA